MSHHCGISTSEVLAVFSEEIVARSGTVLDVFDDGRRLFARSVLPECDEVRPRDRLQAGVALRGTDSEIQVHPYIFRQVCRNGAIMAQVVGTREVLALHQFDTDDARERVREAVVECCAPEVFATNVGQIRSATEIAADLALSLIPLLAGRPEFARLMPSILERFVEGRDTSRFGLMNAITSVARDTRDPEVRWRLEEMGGGIPAALAPTSDDSGSCAEYPSEVLVG